jgi:hypothetical protein
MASALVGVKKLTRVCYELLRNDGSEEKVKQDGLLVLPFP